MPSRQFSPLTVAAVVVHVSAPPTRVASSRPHSHRHLLQPVAVGGGAGLSLLLFFLLLCRKLIRHRTTAASSDASVPRRLSYSALRKGTHSFSPENLLGRGGFGSVYKAVHPGALNQIAVKVMDAGSLQGEREFHNELLFAEKIKKSEKVVTAFGFSHNQRRRRMLLVYELMQNGNLQDALLHRKCKDLMKWRRRFLIAIDIAKGLEFLHSFDPSIIHGDIKPSNILLDQDFRARIADFGLARMKSTESADTRMGTTIDMNGGIMAEENESVVEESMSTVTAAGTEHSTLSLNRTGDSVLRGGVSSEKGENRVTSPSSTAAQSDGTLDNSCRNTSRKEGGDGVVKEYVIDWIGKEVDKDRDWTGTPEKKKKKKRRRKLPEWWKSMDDDKSVKSERRRPAREWWKEEYCEELARKKKKQKKKKGCTGSSATPLPSHHHHHHHQGDTVTATEEDWWPRGEDASMGKKRKTWRKRSRGSMSSVDWWLEGLSGELWRNRQSSFDSASAEIPKSGGVSSTPSMRGTVCYVAPEYGGDADVSEKCDVYSYGVLLLVVIAGRRPLQVSESPLSEFHRANLISWSRHLARTGKLLDLVGQSVEDVDQEEALLAITVALVCLQRCPSRRPSMKEVVGMLCGDLPCPQLPVEYSPSPPSRFTLRKQWSAVP